MPDSALNWSIKLALTAAILIGSTPGPALAEWQLVEEWPQTTLTIQPGEEGIDYDTSLYKYYGVEIIETKQGELIQVTVGSYAFQPALTMFDAAAVPLVRGGHDEPKPAANGYIWYQTSLQFECCPGVNSGDFDVPTQYLLRYSSDEINAVGDVEVTGKRLVWVEAEVPLGPFECNCQDPASGKWYEGSMGGTMCPPVTPETRFCPK